MAIPNQFLYEAGFDEPYLLGGQATTSLVPALYDISIGDHAYLAETSFEPYRRDAYRSDSIENIADKLDITNQPGEAAVNTQSLWRRSAINFELGAGQLFFDREQGQPGGSHPARFKSSKGVYPWTKWQATLLNDTIQMRASSTITQTKVVGGDVYIIDNGNVFFSTNGTSFTQVTGYTAGSALYMASDGSNVYIACGTHGIYLATVGASIAASWITGTVNYVWYVGGWLVATAANNFYNVVTPTTTVGPTALTAAGPAGGTSLVWTNPNGAFVFSSAAAGNSWVYLGGFTSNAGVSNGLVFKTQANSSGTSLVVPLVAASLPNGEVPYSLFAYTNYIMLGSNLGARFCETLGAFDPGGNAGDLKMGPIVPTLIQQVTAPVRDFCGQTRFVWFGWSNYDGLSSGLGRMDLSTFIDQQAPAYTSDLMVTGQGEIMSMDWWSAAPAVLTGYTQSGAPVFVVNGKGLYTASQTIVPNGNIDLGYITYGLPDQKISIQFDWNATGSGLVGASVIVDDGASSTTLPQQAPQGASTLIPMTQLRGELFDVTATMSSSTFVPNKYDTGPTYDSTFTYDSGHPIGSPTLRRVMMKAWPAVISGTQHRVIINCFRWIEGLGTDAYCDPYVEFNYLDGLRQTATPVKFVEGNGFEVTVIIREVIRLVYNARGLPEGGWNQRLEVVMQTLEG